MSAEGIHNTSEGNIEALGFLKSYMTGPFQTGLLRIR